MFLLVLQRGNLQFGRERETCVHKADSKKVLLKAIQRLRFWLHFIIEWLFSLPLYSLWNKDMAIIDHTQQLYNSAYPQAAWRLPSLTKRGLIVVWPSEDDFILSATSDLLRHGGLAGTALCCRLGRPCAVDWTSESKCQLLSVFMSLTSQWCADI